MCPGPSLTSALGTGEGSWRRTGLDRPRSSVEEEEGGGSGSCPITGW